MNTENTNTANPELRETQILAVYIAGKLILRRHITQAHYLNSQDNALYLLIDDIEAAIHEALPELDLMELKRVRGS